MATMTRMMFSNASAENKARIDLLERNLPLKYGQDFDPTSITPDITNRSETFGKLMAMAIMTWARTDGGHEAWALERHAPGFCATAFALVGRKPSFRSEERKGMPGSSTACLFRRNQLSVLQGCSGGLPRQ